MIEIINHSQAALVQIATPHSFGTGFYLKKYNLILTNEHIVRESRNVAVMGTGFPRQMIRVLFWDARLDLAFLEAPEHIASEGLDMNLTAGRTEDTVLAIGHSFGKKLVWKSGKIINSAHEEEGVSFWEHDAVLPPANSGGPLLDTLGKVVAINTFIVRNGKHFGFALPASIIEASISKFIATDRQISGNCEYCRELVTFQSIQRNKCPHCRETIVLPSTIEPYEPHGIAKTIENIIEMAGHEVELSRYGKNNWMIQQGSATINIAYYHKKGLITGDAYLCRLPSKKEGKNDGQLARIYQYLLEQNYEIEGLNFSVKGEDIILSLLIHDRYLNVETGTILFKHLFEKADYHDNMLVEEYGATWRKNSYELELNDQ